MSRQCPFLQLNSGFFSPTYHCQKTGEDVLTGSALYNNYCNNYESSYSQCPNFKPQSNSSGSGCFLTSACTEAKGLPDDCIELTTLRKFRDGWLAAQPDGENIIKDYYRIAPLIVESIHSDANGLEILNELYDELVIPCVEFIQNGENQKAYELYNNSVKELQFKYSLV